MQQDRNHIVSAGYIRNWAVDDMVMCELVPEGKRLLLAPTSVGVRKKFFARSRTADGTRPAGVAEGARGIVETRALPLLRDLADRWPLRDGGDRAWVALWLAMTLCANPQQRTHIPHSVERFFNALDREAPMLSALTAGQRGEFSEPDFELDSMFDDVSTVASLLGQMHWTLLRFGRPALVSSDHPIVSTLWTADEARSAGVPAMQVLDSLEVRVALDPTTALLLTWVDADDRVSAVRPARHHVDVFNRGVWEQAERHRFWQPGTTPRGVDDRRRMAPVSTELFRDYDPKSSTRLDAALAWYQGRLLERKSGLDDHAVVTGWMDQTDEGLTFVPVRHEGEHAGVFSEFGL